MKDESRQREEERIARDQRARMQQAQQDRRAADEQDAMKEANVWLKPLLIVGLATAAIALGSALSLIID